jgi:hypothetical protein
MLLCIRTLMGITLRCLDPKTGQVPRVWVRNVAHRVGR